MIYHEHSITLQDGGVFGYTAKLASRLEYGAFWFLFNGMYLAGATPVKLGK
jgi:hypothetical protein